MTSQNNHSPQYQQLLSGEPASQAWLTPPSLYQSLDSEFNFDFDPCPYPFVNDGIGIEWGRSNYVNPPFRKKDARFGHGPTSFVRKAIDESRKGKTCVLVIPTQSYVNMLLEAGAELRSLGRVRWIDAVTKKESNQPSPITCLILRGALV